MQRIDPNEIIDDIITLIEQKCISKQITIHKDLYEGAIITADPNQLKQAFLNILLNAIDAIPNDGTISITSAIPSQYIIRISDTGCGIAAEDIPNIFDPFFTKKATGTGLGLSITHEIIKNHQGRIFVESEFGKGTTFIIKLPID